MGLGSYPLAAPQGPAGADLRRPNQAPLWARLAPGGNQLTMGVYGRHFRANPAHNGATFRPDLRVRLTGFCLKEKSEEKFFQEKTDQSHSRFWPESGPIVSWMGPKMTTVYPHCELTRAKMETRKAVRQPGTRFWSSGASIRSLWSSRRDQSWAGLGLG